MSSAIVLSSLTEWAQERLNSILTATTEADFDAAFDAFVIKQDAHITVNGHHVSRDAYKQQMLGESAVGGLKQSAEVAFGGAVSVSANKAVPTDSEVRSSLLPYYGIETNYTFLQAGVVGMFYTSTIFLKLKFGGASEETKVNSSLNITSKTAAAVSSRTRLFLSPLDPSGVMSIVGGFKL
ncbi:hypothetical protein HWV62_3436 [Athelia sp. TMB]|nr:hypothetical protein HWV62_3436 [Athelia sp. TMB]